MDNKPTTLELSPNLWLYSFRVHFETLQGIRAASDGIEAVLQDERSWPILLNHAHLFSGVDLGGHCGCHCEGGDGQETTFAAIFQKGVKEALKDKMQHDLLRKLCHSNGCLQLKQARLSDIAANTPPYLE